MPDERARVHGHLRLPRWLLLLLALVLIAGHGLVLRHVSSRLALPAAALVGLVALLALKHLGLAGALRALVRRRESRD